MQKQHSCVEESNTLSNLNTINAICREESEMCWWRHFLFIGDGNTDHGRYLVLHWVAPQAC